MGQPVVTFTLQLRNSSSTPISTNTVQVQVTYGAGHVPAVPANHATTTPFSGTLKPGDSATGTYAFAIPTNQQNDVTVAVWYAQGKPTVLLTGPAH